MYKSHKNLLIVLLTIIFLFDFVNISFSQKSEVGNYFFKVNFDGKRGIYTLDAGHGDMTPYFIPNSIIARKILSVCKVGEYCRLQFTFTESSLPGYVNPWKIQEVIAIRKATKKEWINDMRKY